MHSHARTTRGPSSTRARGPAARLAAAAALATALAAPAFAAGSVTVEQPWMRFIVKATPAAGYMTLKNDGDRAALLTGVSSPACGMLMLHQSQQENGVDSMVHLDEVSVPAHGSLSFSPGGYHLMCMRPQDAMKVGASVPVTLTFEDGQTVTVQFPVKGPGGK